MAESIGQSLDTSVADSIVVQVQIHQGSLDLEQLFQILSAFVSDDVIAQVQCPKRSFFQLLKALTKSLRYERDSLTFTLTIPQHFHCSMRTV